MTDALLYALTKGHPPLREVLDQDAHIPILDIQRATARHFSMTVQRLTADGRSDATARAVAIYLCREFSCHTFAVIGKSFRRDHTTILKAYKKIASEIAENHQLASDIEQIKAAIFGRVNA